MNQFPQLPKLALYVIAAALLAAISRVLWPSLWQPGLPPEVVDRITQEHVVCIGTGEIPIVPGEPRQAECGTVAISAVGEGVVPAEELAAGVERAICYEMTVENPRWETQGATRHELKSFSRTAQKVTVLQGGEWQLFPDNDVEDRIRWSTYSCPE